jgi:large subunit ribosomal protein L24
MNIKKNDTVIVLSGKDKGVKGKVLVAMPAENKVIVEGVNVATCHTKPRRQGETGGIVKKETPIRTCKVALFCSKCGKGVRVGHKIDGDKKVRICRKCGTEI